MKKFKYFSFLICAVFLLTSLPVVAQLSVPFKVRHQSYVKGDMTIIANNIVNRKEKMFDANVSYNSKGYEAKHNDEFYMDYIDIDDDKSTFSSSSAQFSIDNASIVKVLYAGLYWSATYKHNKGKQTSSGKFVAIDKKREAFDWVKLKLPKQSEYIDIKGEILFDGLNVDGFEPNAPYAAYADVTKYLIGLKNPQGNYTVANVKSTLGTLSGGVSAGWTMIIVYEDSAETGKFITTYDGFTGVNKESTEIQFSGFQTLPEGKVNLKIAGAGLEGDLGLKGDQIAFKSAENSEFLILKNDIRDLNNFFNSTITVNDEVFSKRFPNSQNTLGYDSFLMKIFNPDNQIIGNNTKEATIRFKSTGDRYFMFFCAFNVEVLDPIKTINTISSAELITQNTNAPLNTFKANPINTFAFTKSIKKESAVVNKESNALQSKLSSNDKPEINQQNSSATHGVFDSSKDSTVIEVSEKDKQIAEAESNKDDKDFNPLKRFEDILKIAMVMEELDSENKTENATQTEILNQKANPVASTKNPETGKQPVISKNNLAQAKLAKVKNSVKVQKTEVLSQDASNSVAATKNTEQVTKTEISKNKLSETEVAAVEDPEKIQKTEILSKNIVNSIAATKNTELVTKTEILDQNTSKSVVANKNPEPVTKLEISKNKLAQAKVAAVKNPEKIQKTEILSQNASNSVASNKKPEPVTNSEISKNKLTGTEVASVKNSEKIQKSTPKTEILNQNTSNAVVSINNSKPVTKLEISKNNLAQKEVVVVKNSEKIQKSTPKTEILDQNTSKSIVANKNPEPVAKLEISKNKLTGTEVASVKNPEKIQKTALKPEILSQAASNPIALNKNPETGTQAEISKSSSAQVEVAGVKNSEKVQKTALKPEIISKTASNPVALNKNLETGTQPEISKNNVVQAEVAVVKNSEKIQKTAPKTEIISKTASNPVALNKNPETGTQAEISKSSSAQAEVAMIITSEKIPNSEVIADLEAPKVPNATRSVVANSSNAVASSESVENAVPIQTGNADSSKPEKAILVATNSGTATTAQKTQEKSVTTNKYAANTLVINNQTEDGTTYRRQTKNKPTSTAVAVVVKAEKAQNSEINTNTVALKTEKANEIVAMKPSNPEVQETKQLPELKSNTTSQSVSMWQNLEAILKNVSNAATENAKSETQKVPTSVAVASNESAEKNIPVAASDKNKTQTAIASQEKPEKIESLGANAKAISTKTPSENLNVKTSNEVVYAEKLAPKNQVTIAKTGLNQSKVVSAAKPEKTATAGISQKDNMPATLSNIKKLTSASSVLSTTTVMTTKKDSATTKASAVKVNNDVAIAEKEPKIRITPIESESRSFPGVEKGYYIIANVFAVPSNATRFVAKLKAQGIDANYFINPVNNYRYVYVSYHENFAEAQSLYFSDINGKYLGDLWIMTVNKENDLIVDNKMESTTFAQVNAVAFNNNENTNKMLINSSLCFYENAINYICTFEQRNS